MLCPRDRSIGVGIVWNITIKAIKHISKRRLIPMLESNLYYIEFVIVQRSQYDSILCNDIYLIQYRYIYEVFGRFPQSHNFICRINSMNGYMTIE